MTLSNKLIPNQKFTYPFYRHPNHRHVNPSSFPFPTNSTPGPTIHPRNTRLLTSKMSRYSSRRVKVNDPPPKFDAEPDPDDDEKPKLEPFMGEKTRRLASMHRDYSGDYLNVASQPLILRILDKQGDKQVLFADKVLKFTGTGKMKRRILLITDFALYIIDPETYSLKRRIALKNVEKLYLSKLCDNFFAISVPTEYDVLMASTRKSEIVTVLVDAAKSTSNFELDVIFKNRFEYNPAADLVKEVHFEEVEGGVKTRILLKREDVE